VLFTGGCLDLHRQSHTLRKRAGRALLRRLVYAGGASAVSTSCLPLPPLTTKAIRKYYAWYKAALATIGIEWPGPPAYTTRNIGR